MRILSIISSLDPEDGGPIEAVNTIGEELLRLGHVHEILSLDDPSASFLMPHAEGVHAIGPCNLGVYRYTRRLSQWLRANAGGYDVILLNGIWQFHSFGAWRVLSEMKIPYYVFTHGMLDPWFKKNYPLKHLKKSLYWPWADYKVIRDAKAVLFTCEEERILARQSFRQYKCNEVVVAFGTRAAPADAIRLSEYFMNRRPELRGKRLLLFLSRIHKKKGCDLLIDAFSRVAKNDPSIHLVMAGPDSDGWSFELQQQANILNISNRITWTGMLSGDDKWGAYYSSDVFCLPSHQENFGIVVAESLACGKPVLISNKVNIWREIERDGAGLISDDSVDEFEKLIKKWLSLTTPEKLAMERSALNCFSSRFKIDRVVENLLNIVRPNAVSSQ